MENQNRFVKYQNVYIFFPFSLRFSFPRHFFPEFFEITRSVVSDIATSGHRDITLFTYRQSIHRNSYSTEYIQMIFQFVLKKFKKHFENRLTLALR